MQRSCNSCGMVMDGSCSHPRCPGRKSTAVVPHFDTSPSDEIETLRKRVAESDKTSAEHLNARYLAERRAEKAEARIAELEQSLRMKSVVAIGLQNRADELTRRAEKAEAALTEARDRQAAAQRDAENWCKDSILMLGFADIVEEHGLIPSSSELLA